MNTQNLSQHLSLAQQNAQRAQAYKAQEPQRVAVKLAALVQKFSR